MEGRTLPLVLVAACVLLDGDGRILIAKRPEGRSLAGLWEFPGGKVEPGESPEHALIRELAEELGIDIAAADLAPLTFASHDYPDFHLLMPLFHCRRWRGTVAPHEGQELLWVKPAELVSYAMPPADEPLKALLPALSNVSRVVPRESGQAGQGQSLLLPASSRLRDMGDLSLRNMLPSGSTSVTPSGRNEPMSRGASTGTVS